MKTKKTSPASDKSGKKTPNAGSGSFNQGSEQESDYNQGTPVSDEEKKTGKPATKLVRQNQNAEKDSHQ